MRRGTLFVHALEIYRSFSASIVEKMGQVVCGILPTFEPPALNCRVRPGKNTVNVPPGSHFSIPCCGIQRICVWWDGCTFGVHPKTKHIDEADWIISDRRVEIDAPLLFEWIAAEPPASAHNVVPIPIGERIDFVVLLFGRKG